MPHYLVAMQHPDNFDPSTVDEATVHDINVLNDELEAAMPESSLAASAHQPREVAAAAANREVLITDGPYLEAKEHVGGFSILEPMTGTS